MFASKLRPQPHEQRIVGRWEVVGGKVLADDTCKRIDRLKQNYLTKLCASRKLGEWMVLYRDPRDGRFWEATYLDSEMHGGGPPALINISEDEAKGRYDWPDGTSRR